MTIGFMNNLQTEEMQHCTEVDPGFEIGGCVGNSFGTSFFTCTFIFGTTCTFIALNFGLSLLCHMCIT